MIAVVVPIVAVPFIVVAALLLEAWTRWSRRQEQERAVNRDVQLNADPDQPRDW